MKGEYMRSHDVLGGHTRAIYQPKSKRIMMSNKEIYFTSDILKPLIYKITNADNSSDISVQARSFLLKMS